MIRFRATVGALFLLLRAHGADGQSIDACDYHEWRVCESDADCATYERWSALSFLDGVGIASWKDVDYYNYARYACVVPDLAGCSAMRCVPDVASARGFTCDDASDCYAGQDCVDGLCAACAATPGFAEGACWQPTTYGAGHTPPFAEGESGCAGDHCGHECPYDTKCVSVAAGDSFLPIKAPHDALSNVELTPEQSAALSKPATCGGSDEGGMRCAGQIHRFATGTETTPAAIRGRDDDIVELYISKGAEWASVSAATLGEHGRGRLGEEGVSSCGSKYDDETDTWDNTPAHNDNRDDRCVYDWGFTDTFLGWPVDGAVDGVGVAIGAALAWGLSDWHWGKVGLLQCDVRINADLPLHEAWGGAADLDDAKRRSSLETRACVRWETDGGSVEYETAEGEPGHPTTYAFSHDEEWCGDWGRTSDLGLREAIACTVFGPSVTAPAPTAEQRAAMRAAADDALGASSTHADTLRTAFHDAATYSRDETKLEGGAIGCMRFSSVHGAAPNAGIQFTIDDVPPALGCPWASGRLSCPFSFADLVQYAGAISVSALGGPDFSGAVKWGRPDAPWLLCQGESQLAQPDFDGGHKKGFHEVGAAAYGERLKRTFDGTAEYFENELGLELRHWVALLGAHTVGGARGTVEFARATKLPFDTTDDVFDNSFFIRLRDAGDSGFIGLCPQMKAPGEAHWHAQHPDVTFDEWGQGYHDNVITLDTDLSLTTDADAKEWVAAYADDEGSFFEAFSEAYLLVSELGHENLAEIEESPPAPAPAPAPTAPVVEACADSTSWYYKKTSRNCADYVAKKSKFCKSNIVDASGVDSIEACPVTCDSCPAEPGACVDSSTWFTKKTKNTCGAYVAKKAKYCKEKVRDDDGVSSLDACPETCRTCPAEPGACIDSSSWFTKKTKNTCGAYVAKKSKYCKEKVQDEDGFSALEACRMTCDTCGR